MKRAMGLETIQIKNLALKAYPDLLRRIKMLELALRQERYVLFCLSQHEICTQWIHSGNDCGSEQNAGARG